MGAPENAAARPGRGLKIALALSLGLNLLIAGVVIGTLIGGAGRPPGEVRDLGFGPFAEALSPEDRAALRQAFLAEAPDLRGMRRAMRSDMAGLLAALRADPFDPAALRAALDAQDARAQGRLDLGKRLLADRLIALTPAERAAFADRLQAAMTHGRGHRGEDPGGR
jgi:uncharacterized membrane protein